MFETEYVFNIMLGGQWVIVVYGNFSAISSAWNGRPSSRQMRLISYSGDQKLLQIG
jgi:hypothetical protein